MSDVHARHTRRRLCRLWEIIIRPINSLVYIYVLESTVATRKSLRAAAEGVCVMFGVVECPGVTGHAPLLLVPILRGVVVQIPWVGLMDMLQFAATVMVCRCITLRRCKLGLGTDKGDVGYDNTSNGSRSDSSSNNNNNSSSYSSNNKNDSNSSESSSNNNNRSSSEGHDSPLVPTAVDGTKSPVKRWPSLAASKVHVSADNIHHPTSKNLSSSRSITNSTIATTGRNDHNDYSSIVGGGKNHHHVRLVRGTPPRDSSRHDHDAAAADALERIKMKEVIKELLCEKRLQGTPPSKGTHKPFGVRHVDADEIFSHISHTSKH